VRLLAAALLLAGLFAVPQAQEAPGVAAADRLKVDRAMRLRAEIEKACDELEPLIARLSALEKLYAGDCGSKKLAPERSRLTSDIGARVELMGEAMGELKNVSRAQDIVAAIEAHSGRARTRGASEAYLSRSIQSTVERFAKVKGAALAVLSQDDAAHRAARSDCEAQAQRRRWAASLLAVLICAAFLAWRFLGRGAPLALLCLLLPGLSGAQDPLEAAAGRGKIGSALTLKEDADARAGELEESLHRFAALRESYPSACGIERYAGERKRLRAEVEEKMTKLNTVKKALYDVRRTDLYLSLFLTKRQKDRTGNVSRPETADAMFSRACSLALARAKASHDRAAKSLIDEDAGYKAAVQDCAQRKRRLKWLAAAVLPFPALGLLAWLLSRRGALATALLCLLLPALSAEGAEPLDETKVRRVAASCTEGDVLIAELEPALERLKAQQAGYSSTCRLDRLAIERDKTLGEIGVVERRLNATKNDLHAMRRSDMFLSVLTRNKPALVGAAIRGGPKRTAPEPAPQSGAAHEYFTRSYDSCMLRIKAAQYRALRVTEEDELAFKAAKDACLDKRVRNARLAALGAFACLLAGAAWFWQRGRSGLT